MRRLLPRLLLVVALAVAIVGVRVVLNHHATQVASSGPGQAIVTSAHVESTWGIRVTQVAVLADGGLVEMRYLVLDPAKAGRITSGGVQSLPVLVVEGTGHRVTSNSLMFQVHHGNTDNQGSSLSIVYGNANGAVGAGSVVDVVFQDGTRLTGVRVS